MNEFKVLVKDLEEFVKTEKVLFASSSENNKKFYVKLHACPNSERYIVEVNRQSKAFIKKGEAVKHFNAF